MLAPTEQSTCAESYKIIIMGAPRVGKTSITVHFCANEFIQMIATKRRRTATSKQLSDIERDTELMKLRIIEQDNAVRMFNTQPQQAINYLISSGIIDNVPTRKAAFIQDNRSRLDPVMIGRFLFEDRDTLSAFLEYFDFRTKSYVESVAAFFSSFALPTTSTNSPRQYLKHPIIEAFSLHFWRQQMEYLITHPEEVAMNYSPRESNRKKKNEDSRALFATSSLPRFNVYFSSPAAIYTLTKAILFLHFAYRVKQNGYDSLKTDEHFDSLTDCVRSQSDFVDFVLSSGHFANHVIQHSSFIGDDYNTIQKRLIEIQDRYTNNNLAEDNEPISNLHEKTDYVKGYLELLYRHVINHVALSDQVTNDTISFIDRKNRREENELYPVRNRHERYVNLTTRNTDYFVHVTILDNLLPAGQEHFANLEHITIREADAFILLYSVTDLKSMEPVTSYFKKIVRSKEWNITPENAKEYPLFLVGNKADASKQERHITLGQGKKLSEELHGITFFETSTNALPLRLDRIIFDNDGNASMIDMGSNVGESIEVTDLFMQLIRRSKRYNEKYVDVQLSSPTGRFASPRGHNENNIKKDKCKQM